MSLVPIYYTCIMIHFYIILIQRFHELDINRIHGVMVSVLASSVIDRGFEPRSGQTKNYKICICCFWLARNQDDVSEWSDMSTHGLLFQ